MKNLKRLSAAVALTFILGAAAFAGEIPSGPCAPPAPGETSAPPCTGQTASDNSTLPGEVNTPPASDAGTGYLVAEAALSVFESLLSIF